MDSSEKIKKVNKPIKSTIKKGKGKETGKGKEKEKGENGPAKSTIKKGRSVNKLKNASSSEDDTMFPFLYPDINDEEFNVKIARRKEFAENSQNIEKTEINEICGNDVFELAPHQQFVRNFMSSNTPYNSLLLYHGLGSGKTCSAITIAEEYREHNSKTNRLNKIMIIASPNVQINFRLQLFDPVKLTENSGVVESNSCSGNKFLKYINPMNIKNLSEQDIAKQINTLIDENYIFMGYQEFANQIQSLKGNREAIDLTYGNRLIIIDEVHNLRNVYDKKGASNFIYDAIKKAENIKLVLLTATPMYNSYKEIIWLINLMNVNDRRKEIKEGDIFDKEGMFKKTGNVESGKNMLIKKATGYISFVRGDNPISFPHRVWPKMFSIENTFDSKDGHAYPEKHFNRIGNLSEYQRKPIVPVFLVTLGETQQNAYDYIMNETKIPDVSEIDDNEAEPDEDVEGVGLGCNALLGRIQALSMIYPDMSESGKISKQQKYFVGGKGLKTAMTYNTKDITNFEYRPEYINKGKGIFNNSEIGKYSAKIKTICEWIKDAEGVVLIYSEFIFGGIIPMALALEELGYTRSSSIRPSLFKEDKSRKKNGLKYAVITGNVHLSPPLKNEIALCTEGNSDGAKIKVILISKAGSEGIDFKNIRQVHIIEPWYNLSRIEQVIGRAVRMCGHKELTDAMKRNVQIFLYASILYGRSSIIEAVDLYIYRIAGVKAKQIGTVSRVLKETSVDCLLNTPLNEHSKKKTDSKNIKLSVLKRVGNGIKYEIIPYKIEDILDSAICDYMENCDIKCNPPGPVGKVEDYNYSSPLGYNNEIITRKIKSLMKHLFVYSREGIIAGVNTGYKYSDNEIYSTLTALIDNKNEVFKDKYGRYGRLVNVDNLYLFQPIELTNEHISMYDRSTPIDFKQREVAMIGLFPGEPTGVEDASPTSIIDHLRKQYDIIYNLEEAIGVVGNIENKTNYTYNRVCKAIYTNLKAENRQIYENLSTAVISHMVENLKGSDKKGLIEYLLTTSNDELDDFQKRLKEYILSLTYESSSKKGPKIGVYIFNGVENEFYVIDGKVMSVAAALDLTRFKPSQDQRVQDIKLGLDEVVGFTSINKKQGIVFKTKIIKKNECLKMRNTGAVCRGENLDIMNMILGKPHNKKFKEFVTDGKKKKPKIKKNTILFECFLQEMLLRYNNVKDKNKKKYWVLTTEESELIGIQKCNLEV